MDIEPIAHLSTRICNDAKKKKNPNLIPFILSTSRPPPSTICLPLFPVHPPPPHLSPSWPVPSIPPIPWRRDEEARAQLVEEVEGDASPSPRRIHPFDLQRLARGTRRPRAAPHLKNRPIGPSTRTMQRTTPSPGSPHLLIPARSGRSAQFHDLCYVLGCIDGFAVFCRCGPYNQYTKKRASRPKFPVV